MKHRADAYCLVCGGRCVVLPEPIEKPLSLGPAFTGAGSPTFKPSRKPGKFD